MLSEKQIVTEELQDMAKRIADNLDSTGTTASGRTAKSLRVEGTDFGALMLARRNFKGVEIGNAPGKYPKGFNQIIKQWILDKGISITQLPYKRKASANFSQKYSAEERGLNAMAGAISHSIIKSGTDLFKKGGRDDIYSNELKVTTGIIKKRLASEIISQIKSNIKG